MASDPTAAPRQVVLDILRALFGVGQVLLALLLLVYTILGFGLAANPPAFVIDTVVPAIGFDDVAVLALAAIVAATGSVLSFRYWLKRSWHVVTVAIATAAGMISFVVLGLQTIRH